MEYQLEVWAPPADLPARHGISEVHDAMMRVAGQSLGINPKFVALGEALVAALPVAGPPDARQGVWPRDPLAAAQRQGGGVWTIWLPDEPLLVCYRLVVRRALPLGLGVFDPQLLVYFAPDGRVAPTLERPVWAHIEQEVATLLPPVTTVAWLERIVDALTPLLVPRGFAIERPAAFNRVFSRVVEDGHQKVSIDLETLHGRYQCFVQCAHADDACERIIAQALPDPHLAATLRFSAGIFDIGPNDRIDVRDAAAVERLASMLAGKPIEVLDLARTRAGLDAALNDASRFPFTRSPSHPAAARSLHDACRHHWVDGARAVSVAWLVGRADVDTLVAQTRSRVPPTWPGALAGFDQVIAHLREHVPRGAG